MARKLHAECEQVAIDLDHPCPAGLGAK